MKPVVIVGKSANAKWIPCSEEYDIACISESIRMVDHAQWLAFNDIPAFEELTSMDINKAERVVLPTYLHVDTRAREVVFWEEVAAKIKPEVVLYELPTAPESIDDVPNFGVCWSTTESLVCYLLLAGYREFLFNGVDNGNVNYHPLFKARVPKNRNHFTTNYSRVMKRIIGAGGQARQWREAFASC